MKTIRLAERAIEAATIPMLAALVALLFLSCDSTSPPTVASVNGVAASPSPHQDFRAFIDCMAKHGIEVKSDGSLAAAIPPPSYSQALGACARLAPVVEADSGSVPPELVARMLAYSRCMRAHGVDVPDPVMQYGMAAINVPAEVYNTPQYREADKVCRTAVPPSPTPTRT